MISGIYVEDLPWICLVFVLFVFFLFFCFTKNLSRLEENGGKFLQGGEMEITKERRKKKSWWVRFFEMFSDKCHICKAKSATHIADCRRTDTFVSVCGDCVGHFKNAQEISNALNKTELI